MKNLLPSALACVIFASCAPMTPQARIDHNPQVFAALSSRDQELVRQGQIARGMSPDAVALAWGPPQRRVEGTKGNRRVDRWDYTVLRPVYSTNVFGGYGYGGYGRYGRYNYSSFGFGPEVAYLPQQVASVWFENQKVEAWERLR
jgi:hypothetical protein